LNKDKIIYGRKVILTEIEPKFFEPLIKWRNDTELNKYLNQPFVLTLDSEKIWYEQKYLNDSTQMLYIMLDKENEKPFGTMGYVNYDEKEKICISARLIAGKREHQGSVHLIEGLYLFFKHLYEDLKIQTIFSYVVKENIQSLRLQKRFGLFENPNPPKFPERLKDNALPMVEIVGTPETFKKSVVKVEQFLNSLGG